MLADADEMLSEDGHFGSFSVLFEAPQLLIWLTCPACEIIAFGVAYVVS